MLFILIAYAISALGALLGAQRLLLVFEKESFDRHAFFSSLKESPAPRRGAFRAWLICLGAQILLLAAVFYTAVIRLGIEYSYAYYGLTIALAAVFLVAMALYYRGWRKKAGEKPPEGAGVLRVDVFFLLIVALLHVAMILLFIFALAAAAQLAPSGSQTAGAYSTVDLIFSVAMLAAPYLSLAVSQLLAVTLAPRWLSLAVLLSRPFLVSDQKKKD